MRFSPTRTPKKVYRLFCQRLSVLASNMRLKGLWTAIANASAKADGILATHTATQACETSARDDPTVNFAPGASAKLNRSASSSKASTRRAGPRATKTNGMKAQLRSYPMCEARRYLQNHLCDCQQLAVRSPVTICFVKYSVSHTSLGQSLAASVAGP